MPLATSRQKQRLGASLRRSHAGAVRRAGSVPAILYGHGLTTQPILQVPEKEFRQVWRQTGSTSLITLTVDGRNEHQVLIREVQRHPVKGNIIHADFYQVRLDEAIRARVPMRFVGEAAAVKDLGGVLLRTMDEIELEALPQDLPHEIEVNISALSNFEKIIHVADLQVPPRVKLLQHGDAVVASVQPPRTEAELEALKEEVKEEVEAVAGVAKEEAVPAEEQTDKEKQPSKEPPEK